MNNSGKTNKGNNFTARVGLLSAARVLQAAVVFLVFWLYAVSLTRDVYGNFQTIFVVIGFGSALIPLGLPLLIASLPSDEIHSLTIGVIFKKIGYHGLVVLALAVFVLFSFSAAAWPTKFLILLLSVVNACYIAIEIFAIRLGRDRDIFFTNILYSAAYGLCHWIVLKRNPFSIDLLLILLVALSAARLIWLVPKKTALFFSKSSATGDIEQIYHRQWLFLSMNEALEAFSKYFDRLFLLWLLTASAFAIYFNGSYEIPLLGIFISVSGTFITVHAKRDQLSEQGILSLFHQSCIQLSFLLFPLFFFLQLNAAALFEWLFQGKYNESIPIFMVSCWIIPFRTANYTAILQNRFKGDRIFRGSLIGLCVKILCCVLLYSLWGAKGVALSVLIGTVAQIIYYLYQTASALGVQKRNIIPFKTLFVIFIVSGCMVYLARQIGKSSSGLTGLLIGAAGMTASLAIFIFFRKFFLGQSKTASPV